MKKFINPEKKCFLCGKKKNLIKTDCCNQWICDDETNYELFSYARNSCSRNHRIYTLCGHHYAEGHETSKTGPGNFLQEGEGKILNITIFINIYSNSYEK